MQNYLTSTIGNCLALALVLHHSIDYMSVDLIEISHSGVHNISR